jgi:hypothetical protein
MGITVKTTKESEGFETFECHYIKNHWSPKSVFTKRAIVLPSASFPQTVIHQNCREDDEIAAQTGEGVCTPPYGPIVPHDREAGEPHLFDEQDWRRHEHERLFRTIKPQRGSGVAS